MANSGDLIELLSKLKVDQTPTALAFQMDNPYATLASAGPAYAQRGADINNQSMMDAIRQRVSGMIPAQRQHETQLETIKRLTPGSSQMAQLVSKILGGDPELGALDASTDIQNTQAQTLERQAGAAEKGSNTDFPISIQSHILDRMGIKGPQRGTPRGVRSSAAGQPITVNETDKVSRKENSMRDGRWGEDTRTTTKQIKNQRPSKVKADTTHDVTPPKQDTYNGAPIDSVRHPDGSISITIDGETLTFSKEEYDRYTKPNR